MLAPFGKPHIGGLQWAPWNPTAIAALARADVDAVPTPGVSIRARSVVTIARRALALTALHAQACTPSRQAYLFNEFQIQDR